VANLVYTLLVGIPACGLTCFALGFKLVTLPPARR
jgi:hypothetical protein